MKRLLIAAAVFGLLCSSASAGTVSARDLLLYFPCHVKDGAVLADVTADPTNARLGSTASWSDQTPSGRAFSIKLTGESSGAASQDTISTASPVAKLDNLKAFTLLLWINPEVDLGRSERLIANAGRTGGGIDWFVASDAVRGAVKLGLRVNGTQHVLKGTVQVPAGKWSMLVATWDGAVVRFYRGGLNDEVKAVGVGALKPPTGRTAGVSEAPLLIGATPQVPHGDRSPRALFHEIRIYRLALPLNAIEALRQMVASPRGA